MSIRLNMAPNINWFYKTVTKQSCNKCIRSGQWFFWPNLVATGYSYAKWPLGDLWPGGALRKCAHKPRGPVSYPHCLIIYGYNFCSDDLLNKPNVIIQWTLKYHSIDVVWLASWWRHQSLTNPREVLFLLFSCNSLYVGKMEPPIKFKKEKHDII